MSNVTQCYYSNFLQSNENFTANTDISNLLNNDFDSSMGTTVEIKDIFI